jgi:hypothetical protein
MQESHGRVVRQHRSTKSGDTPTADKLQWREQLWLGCGTATESLCGGGQSHAGIGDVCACGLQGDRAIEIMKLGRKVHACVVHGERNSSENTATVKSTHTQEEGNIRRALATNTSSTNSCCTGQGGNHHKHLQRPLHHPPPTSALLMCVCGHWRCTGTVRAALRW